MVTAQKVLCVAEFTEKLHAKILYNHLVVWSNPGIEARELDTFKQYAKILEEIK